MSNAFASAASALCRLLGIFSFVVAPLAALWDALEHVWALWDWLLLTALCPPVSIFAALGFRALPVAVAAYFFCHAVWAWLGEVAPEDAARLLAEGGAAAALGVGSHALGVPYKPRAMYAAAFLVAHVCVLLPHTGAATAALLAAAPLFVLARDVVPPDAVAAALRFLGL